MLDEKSEKPSKWANIVLQSGVNNSASKHGMSFFKFPVKNAKLLKKWLKNLKRKNFKATNTSYLCHEHFTTEDNLSHPMKRQLKENAVPTIFHVPDYLVKKTKPRQTQTAARAQINDVSKLGVSSTINKPEEKGRGGIAEVKGEAEAKRDDEGGAMEGTKVLEEAEGEAKSGEEKEEVDSGSSRKEETRAIEMCLKFNDKVFSQIKLDHCYSTRISTRSIIEQNNNLKKEIAMLHFLKNKKINLKPCFF